MTHPNARGGGRDVDVDVDVDVAARAEVVGCEWPRREEAWPHPVHGT